MSAPGETDHAKADAVFDSVAELFGLLSTPVRLKIIGALCNGEKNVSQLLGDIDTTQPNMSQHLSTLDRAGVLGKRREATQIYYRIESERAATLCRAVYDPRRDDADFRRSLSDDPQQQPAYPQQAPQGYQQAPQGYPAAPQQPQQQPQRAPLQGVQAAQPAL